MLCRRNKKKKGYDKTIEQTEAAYTKIMQSSHTLLHVLKSEGKKLDDGDDYDDDEKIEYNEKCHF